MPVENKNVQDDADESIEVVVEEDTGKAAETQSDAGGTVEADKGTGGGQQEESDKSQGQPVAAGGDDELEQYSEGVKRRIAKLTGKMREAERQREAALEYAKSAKAQAEENAKRVAALEAYHMREYGERLKAQEVLLNNSLTSAIETGNTAKQIEAQKALADLAIEKRTYANMEAQRQNAAAFRQQQQQTPQQQPQQQVQAPPVPDAKAQAWAARNEWFGQDEAMTVTAFAHHKKLVEQEGVDPTSDEYYAELDRRIRADFPHKFAPQRTNGQQRPTTVAPAVRQPAQAANAAKPANVVKLSPSQVAIAKKLGVPLEQYARQVAKLNREG